MHVPIQFFQNEPAYFDTADYRCKVFMKLAPVVNGSKLFYSSLTLRHNKLDCLFPASFWTRLILKVRPESQPLERGSLRGSTQVGSNHTCQYARNNLYRDKRSRLSKQSGKIRWNPSLCQVFHPSLIFVGKHSHRLKKYSTQVSFGRCSPPE